MFPRWQGASSSFVTLFVFLSSSALTTFVGSPERVLVLLKVILQQFAPVRLLRELMGLVWTSMVLGDNKHDKICKQHHQQVQSVHGDVCAKHKTRPVHIQKVCLASLTLTWSEENVNQSPPFAANYSLKREEKTEVQSKRLLVKSQRNKLCIPVLPNSPRCYRGVCLNTDTLQI